MPPPTGTFIRRLTAFMSFAGPVGYVAMIVAVAIHEILGHGLTAWILGGTFRGFALFPDGMGWASASCARYPIVVLAAGVVACIGAGCGFLLIAVWVKHPLHRMTWLLLATLAFEDAAPYVFWNSVFPSPPGDFGRILLQYPNDALRWSLIIGGGITYLVSTVGLTVLSFRCVESVVGPLTRHRAIFIAWGLFGLGGGAGWFTFDWNQLIENVGRLPQFVGAALQLSIAPILVALRRRELETSAISKRAWCVSLVASWLAAGAVVILLLVWFSHGVEW